jgi:NADH-quinone oxidoreductase subunit K
MPELLTLTAGPSTIDVGVIGSIPVSWFLALAACLFVIGVLGVMIRRNPIVILVCTELMLNAVNLTLVTFARQLQDLQGQLFALMVIVVAAAEAVAGLAILVNIFQTRDLDDVDDLSELKG